MVTPSPVPRTFELLYAPELVNDLPAGGKRLIQNVEGYDATIKSGVITYENGIATKKLPGRLIRS